MTVTFTWWAIPVALAITGMFSLYLSGNARGGMFAGFYEALIGVALLFSAAASALTGWLK